jgi:ankyrin repeat protein
LLQQGADVDALNKAKKTAAELATVNDKTEVAKFIGEYKADTDIQTKIRPTTSDTAQDGDGKYEEMALFHGATYMGDIDVLKSLLDRGADVNIRDESHRTPLCVAAFKGNLGVARLLVERGAEVDTRDKEGRTPLHYASRFGHLEVSRMLVNHGANVNARQQDLCTPLHLSVGNGRALITGSLGVEKLLLEHGADVHAVNVNGQTPYELSLRRGYREVTELLAGAEKGLRSFYVLWLKCDV